MLICATMGRLQSGDFKANAAFLGGLEPLEQHHGRREQEGHEPPVVAERMAICNT